MSDFWIALFSSVGFVYIINNFFIFNLKNSLAETYIMNNNYISNCTKWECFKMYAVAKERTSKTLKYIKGCLVNKNIGKNIIFITNGVRQEKHYIENCPKNKILVNTIPDDVSKFDLILYRTPSKSNNFDYDLVRLPNTIEAVNNHKDISQTPYKDKIYSPEISFDNSSLTYELDIKRDNYYVVGNKIFDYPFIKWIIREKYNTDIPNQNYTITYLDEDMNENNLTNNEYLVIKEDSIVKEKDASSTECNKIDKVEEAHSNGWGFW
jgi:hypothetical protein